MVKTSETDLVINTKFPKSWDTFNKLNYLAGEINTFLIYVDTCNMEGIVDKSGYIERILEAHPYLENFYSANLNEYIKTKNELNKICGCTKKEEWVRKELIEIEKNEEMRLKKLHEKS